MIVSERKKRVKKPADIAKIIQSILHLETEIDRGKEHFWAIGLNTKNVIQFIELVFLGSLDSTAVHPREIFRLAITKGVAKIIVCHNHPSGEVDPSKEDRAFFKRLRKVGAILGIPLLDFLIISENNFKSLCAEEVRQQNGKNRSH